MNIKLKGVLLILLGITITGLAQNTVSLKIGDKAPETDRQIVDTANRNTTLSDIAGSNGLLVIFSSNTCPWVAKWEDRLNEIAGLAAQNDIGVVALNPNERARNRGESMDDMRRRAQKQGYNFTYALDEGHKIADAFGATHTPEAFLFDENLQLVYHGAIDDNANAAQEVNSKYLEEAILNIVNGEEVQNSNTEIRGCTIKRTE